MLSQSPLPKRDRTRARLRLAALDLVERQGFEQTTVAQIAAAAGVTPMTFFRHFGSKARVILEDPYDPVIASAIGQQPVDLPPLHRVASGLRRASESLPEPTSEVERRRMRLAVSTPALWGEALARNRQTEQLIVEQLLADGTDRLVARAAAAAALAAITAALFEWSEGDGGAISEAVDRALAVLEAPGG